MSELIDIEIDSEGLKPNSLYTTRETATLLRISPRTLERWRHDGRGPRVTRLWENGRPLYRGINILAALDMSQAE